MATVISVVKTIDRPLRDEVAEFMDSLTTEREWFVTPVAEVLASELLILARVDGELAGLTGVTRRFAHLPFGYYVVKHGHQGKGLAKALYQAKRPYLEPYLCVFAIIMSGNAKTVSWARRRNEFICYDDGEYAFVCSSQRRAVGMLIGAALRVGLPVLLAARRAIKSRSGPRASR